jgi:F-type H+-transporting ATPase subunit b
MTIDYTLFVQIVLFIALWLVLKRLWFDPALHLIRERTARSEGAVKEARAIQAEAERLRAEHAAALDQAKGEAQSQMQEMLRQAESQQQRLIAEAREDAQRTATEVRARIEEEVTKARAGLRDSAGEIARIVAQKILGRPA